MTGRSLYEKILDAHTVRVLPDGDTLIYIDLHLLHEVTSPQAFSGLRQRGLGVRRPGLSLAVAEHNTPTEHQDRGLKAFDDPEARAMVSTFYDNATANSIELIPMGDPRNGIVHVIGPELGRTRPGMTIVCGDSHTSTHGAFGALAHGIGTSEVEHVLATQTLRTRRMTNMAVRFSGHLGPHCSAKDMALHLIADIGAGGGTGCVIEFQGDAVTALGMEGRMTLCNMSIEAGARAGLIAPDEVTCRYLAERGVQTDDRDHELVSDDDTSWHRRVEIDASQIRPMVSWGTSPEQSVAIGDRIPDPTSMTDPVRRAAAERALAYMGLSPGQGLDGVAVDRVFIGSCTNSRIEDLRAAAAIAATGRVATGVRAMVVPGSNRVRAQAQDEGLDAVFIKSGFEWRQPGCSMCLGMNPDRLAPQERCASTSNRNFEGRQGRGGRTHLMSPTMAAHAALSGAICRP